MTRRLISSGSSLEAKAGYSRVVVDGEWIFVSGTTRNIESALAQAWASLADVVRATYYVADAADWPAVLDLLGGYFGAIRPASTALICALIDPRIKIEIEVTARKR